MESWVRWVGLFAFLVIGIALWMGWRFRIDPEKLPKGLKPMLALELAESADELAGVLGEGPRGEANRQAARGELKVDFLFIAAYWLLFLAAGVLLSRRNLSWGIPLGVAAA